MRWLWQLAQMQQQSDAAHAYALLVLSLDLTCQDLSHVCHIGVHPEVMQMLRDIQLRLLQLTRQQED